MKTAPRVLASLVPLALLLGCGAESDRIVYGIQAQSFANSEWSEPVNLGATINSAFAENHPNLSKDELSLYFTSDRPGGAGTSDLWVARRACEDCLWETPVNVGSVINSSSIDAGSDVSSDGHVLFFFSNRPGGVGGNDMYVSRRTDKSDDLAWGAPMILGSDVNTAGDENAPTFRANDLYFTRGNNALAQQDLYVAPMARDGETSGPAVAISELNHPGANDAAPTVRTDGREIFFQRSAQAGGVGAADLWTSTRQSADGVWSTPVNLGPGMNSTDFEQQASLSHDGRTLLWASNRAGGVGGFDIYMSTRTPSGQ